MYLFNNYSWSTYSKPGIILGTTEVNKIDKVPKTLLQWQK